jgi:probable DNA repair protein
MNPQKLDSYLLDNRALPETPLLSTIIQSLGGQQEKAAARKSFAGWADLFAQWLEICGWPGDESLDSVQHQVIDVFRDEITRLRTLDIVCDAVKLDTALARLHNRLGEQPFQVESTTSSIEILGVSECSGLEFDAIWFAGMNENDWPPPLDRSPFLPLNLQKESGYHGADLEKNLAYAAMLQNRLYHQANEILFSRTRFEKDVALYPGPLFQEPEQTPSPPRSLIRELQDYAPEMEIYQDHHGTPLVTGNPKGGARLIEDQAACPFRAYARHRLGADDREPRDQGLDPADRGRLVHSILESLWKQVQTSENLAALSELELGRMLDHCISSQSRKFYRTSGVKSGFFNAQSSWLKKLLLEWFAIEQQRQLGFTVVASELPVTLDLGEIVLNLKIDRIDELEDGSLALIDYKTGDARPVSNWIGERPGYPQLALYALSLYDNAEQVESRSLSALLVAQLKFGNCNHTGFVLGDDFYCESFPGKKVPGLDKTRINAELKSWPQIHSHWQSTLSGLARQFRQGEARVDPVDENACRNCNLHTLCRVSGQQRQQLEAL